MIDALRSRLVRRKLSAALESRTPVALDVPPPERRLLLLLPAETERQGEVWSFVTSLGLPPSRVRPVVIGETVGRAPDAYAGEVRRVSPEDLTWLQLPSAETQHDVWTPAPHVALSFADSGDPITQLLAGCSPAAFRMGLHVPEAEPFFDLLVTGGGSGGSAPLDPATPLTEPSRPALEASMRALLQALERIAPPILPLPRAADS